MQNNKAGRMSNMMQEELRQLPSTRKLNLSNGLRREICKGSVITAPRTHVKIGASKRYGSILPESLNVLTTKIFYKHFEDLGRKRISFKNADYDNSSMKVIQSVRYREIDEYLRENDDIVFAIMLDEKSFMYCRYHVDIIGNEIFLTVTESKKMDLFSLKLDSAAINVKGVHERKFVKHFNALHNK